MYRNVEIILYDENVLNEKLKLISDEKNIEFAYILHDKDKDIKPHYHLRLFCKDKKSLSSWSKLLLCDTHDIEILQFKKLSIRYLIHLDNPEKFQYSKENIFSNFDISPYLNIEYNEQSQVEQIISFIIESDYYLYLRNVYEYVILNNLWSTYRRNYSIIKEILFEHNIHFS